MGMNSTSVYFANELPGIATIVEKLREVTELEIHLEDYCQDEEGQMGNIFSNEPAHYVGIFHETVENKRFVQLCTTDFGATYLVESTRFILVALGGNLMSLGATSPSTKPLPLWAGLPWHQAKDYLPQETN